jgi:hypothetical protein
VQGEGKWSSRRQAGFVAGFIMLMLVFCHLGLYLEYRAISMWWLVVYLLPLAFIIKLQPDWGWGPLRLSLLGDLALPVAGLVTVFCWDGEDTRADWRREGQADRIAALYARDPQGSQPLLASAESETLDRIDDRIPKWIVDGERERRRLEALDEKLAEQRRRAEAQRRDDEFAATPVGRALGLILVVGWLLSEMLD